MSVENFELYTPGTRVWVPDRDLVWRSGALAETFKPGQQKLRVLIGADDDELDEWEVTVDVKRRGLPPLRNPDLLVGKDDLTTLSYLHEPAVLHNLRVRFEDNRQFYTYCGIVLVAINPYEEVPIYGEEMIDAYRGTEPGQLDPHIFAVSETAFSEMVRFERNQSIIVSGESGAGKTVSAKFAMRYFAAVGGSQSQTEAKVLASNPILESIGNAKTVRNDNSSRFGKFVEIGFNRRHQIIGASINTYLLEKSRVVFQATNERNYHIFYQLCSVWNVPEFHSLSLERAETFTYTNQGLSEHDHSISLAVDGIDDREEFLTTRKALDLLGMTETDQWAMLEILAAILHLGNISIEPDEHDVGVVVGHDRYLLVFCELMDISDSSLLAYWLTHRRLQTRSDTLDKPLDTLTARFSRDALAKHIYQLLFSWVVQRVNKTLRAVENQHRFIGVLDIYGFETFDENSFEQFCINYANEKLQQQFNAHVFRLEQEEYIREEIDWSMITYHDNQPAIDLIEARLGILDLLDEECTMPNGSDTNWHQKLMHQHLNNELFSRPRISRRQLSFVVTHFADQVEYIVDGFVEKNRDSVLDQQTVLMRNAGHSLLSELFQTQTETAKPPPVRAGQPPAKRQKQTKKSVGSQFRDSLIALMGRLNTTTPHYVRCIKPNDDKLPFTFEPQRAVQQLRACGVLETVRISAAGYPTRWSYKEFVLRYRVLIKGALPSAPRDAATDIVKKLMGIDSSVTQFGKSKIFFRAGKLAFLERLRSEKLDQSARTITRIVRGRRDRLNYLKIQRSVLLIQSYGRGVLARRLAVLIRQRRAAICIQANWRMFVIRRRYVLMCQWLIKIQAASRAVLARRYAQRLRYLRAAITIQRYYRGWRERKRFKRALRGIVLLQSHVRRKLAKRLLKRLKIEARSADHLKKLNKGLENKIFQLQRRLDAQTAEQQTAYTLATTRGDELTRLRTEFQHHTSSCQARITALEKELADVIRERDEFLTDRNNLELELSRVETSLTENRDELAKEHESGQRRESQLDEREAGALERLLTSERALSEERQLRQQLLAEHSRLQERLEGLQSIIPGTDSVRTPVNKRGNERDSSQPSPYTALKEHELEIENARLRADLNQLREAASAKEPAAKTLSEQIGFLESELSRRTEECLELKAVLVERRNSSNDLDEDGELTQAYQSQVQLNRSLSQQLDAALAELRNYRSMAGKELQTEIHRLTAENTDLRELIDQRDKKIHRYKKALKLRAVEERSLASTKIDEDELDEASPEKADAEILGLLEFREEQESLIIQCLISSLRPDQAARYLPGLPAYIVFMLIRWTDYINDMRRLKTLLTAVVNGFSKTLKKNSDDLERVCVWLANVVRLMHLLKQYSGDTVYQEGNSRRQRLHSLQHFDLSDFHQILSDRAVVIFQALVRLASSLLQPFVIPGLLEHDSISMDHDTVMLSDHHSRADQQRVGHSLDTLVRSLSQFDQLLTRFAIDPDVERQLFRQLFYFMNSVALNGLLLRKHLCNWEKGMQIRYNVTHLEQWSRDHQPGADDIIDSLQPLVQASQLLQSPASERHVQQLVDNCDRLSSAQIVKLLNNYSPTDPQDAGVGIGFIRRVEELLRSSRSIDARPRLLNDTKYQFPVVFPYSHSPVELDTIEIPSELNLNFLVKR